METLIFHRLFEVKEFALLTLFIGMIIEGEVVLFSAAFLVREGYLKPGPVFFAAFAGMLIGDVLWYWLGRWAYDSFPRLRRWIDRIAAPLDRHIRERLFRSIFISKFAAGIHHPVLMRAGSLGISLKRFVFDDIISTFIWVLVIGGLGYLSGFSFEFSRQFLRFAELGLLIALIIFFLLFRAVSQKTKARL